MQSYYYLYNILNNIVNFVHNFQCLQPKTSKQKQINSHYSKTNYTMKNIGVRNFIHHISYLMVCGSREKKRFTGVACCARNQGGSLITVLIFHSLYRVCESAKSVQLCLLFILCSFLIHERLTKYIYVLLYGIE